MTPEFQRNKRKSNKNDLRNSHHVSHPETMDDFVKLDFASRCAVAGLQLGRTKVFLRREAFDRIEGLRSEKFYKAASSIQKMVRGGLCRDWFQSLRRAAIVIQSFMRVQLSQCCVFEHRIDRAAVTMLSSVLGAYSFLACTSSKFSWRIEQLL